MLVTDQTSEYVKCLPLFWKELDETLLRQLVNYLKYTISECRTIVIIASQMNVKNKVINENNHKMEPWTQPVSMSEDAGEIYVCVFVRKQLTAVPELLCQGPCTAAKNRGP